MSTNKLVSLVGNDVCYIKLVRFPFPKELLSARVRDYFKQSIIFLNLCCRKARHLQMHHCKPDIWEETVQWKIPQLLPGHLDDPRCTIVHVHHHHNCTSTTPSWWSIASGILSRASHNHCDEKMGSGKGNGNIHWSVAFMVLLSILSRGTWTLDPK